MLGYATPYRLSNSLHPLTTELEENIRAYAEPDTSSCCVKFIRSCRDSVLDLYGAWKIFWLHLITFEAILDVLCAIVSTSLYYYYGSHNQDDKHSFGAHLSWVLVSFAVVSPLVLQIRLAFMRREFALQMLADAKSLMTNILLAHTVWGIGNQIRHKIPKDHAKNAKNALKNLWIDFATSLLLPTFNRGRHRMTNAGWTQVSKCMSTFEQMQVSKGRHFRRLYELVEVMKVAGLPGNEASRINQFHWMLQARMENIQNVKFYRTPQATRSFTRLFIFVLPIFYGPYYVYLLHSYQTMYTNFAYCLAFSVLTSLTMVGIFNVEKAMEDPFTPIGMDGLRVQDETESLFRTMDEAYQQGTDGEDPNGQEPQGAFPSSDINIQMD